MNARTLSENKSIRFERDRPIRASENLAYETPFELSERALNHGELRTDLSPYLESYEFKGSFQEFVYSEFVRLRHCLSRLKGL